MIVYKATKEKFVSDVFLHNIEDLVAEAVKNRLGKNVGQSEYQSWANSIPQVEQILRDPEIPPDAGVAIEYSIPRTQNRIDILITGLDELGNKKIILIELKQWQKAELTKKDGVVRTRFSHGNSDTLHPSYQAWSYATLLNSFNVAVYEGDILLRPCAYLHNYQDDGIISNAFYSEYIQKAPLFFKTDKKPLRDYVKRHIRSGDTDDILDLVENGDIRPSKQLADQLSSMLKGNKEFILIDAQKEIFEEAKQLAEKAKTGKKQVFIVNGGPGTGKSVVAINLLVDFINVGLVAQYVTRNSAPREVYAAKLTGTMKKSVFSSLFKNSGSYVDVTENSFDALIVDEAHRLNYKSGMVGHLGENQVKEIINAANFSIFFLDEDQRVTLKDIGSQEEIEQWAKEFDADITIAELTSQFRCSGSNGYLAWLDDSLGIRSTANSKLSQGEYDFRIYDDPNKLREAILALNNDSSTARLVAGYCWPWVSKTTTKRWKKMSKEERANTFDITFPKFDFAMRWNLVDQGQGWLIHPNSINEIGCIHTCQGLEVDYIGVIIGDDFRIRNGEVVIDPSAHPGQDKALQSWRTIVKDDPVEGRRQVETVIKNTYRTLMSRGLKGCFIFCDDPETLKYFAQRLTE
jgi:DUF2075 family protein